MYHNTSYWNLVNIYIYNAAFQNDKDNHTGSCVNLQMILCPGTSKNSKEDSKFKLWIFH